MDKVAKYEAAILSILSDYEKVVYSNVTGHNDLVADHNNKRYLIVTVGWDGKKFIHDCPLHFDIINEKIWIQCNMTELDVGVLLEKQGVPKSDIVIGFLSEKMREYTEYAVA